MTKEYDRYETAGRPPTLTPVQEFEIRRYREAGASIKQCASMFEISVTTVYRVLAKQRKKLGLEKLPRRQSARSDAARGVIHEPQ